MKISFFELHLFVVVLWEIELSFVIIKENKKDKPMYGQCIDGFSFVRSELKYPNIMLVRCFAMSGRMLQLIKPPIFI